MPLGNSTVKKIINSHAHLLGSTLLSGMLCLHGRQFSFAIAIAFVYADIAGSSGVHHRRGGGSRRDVEQ